MSSSKRSFQLLQLFRAERRSVTLGPLHGRAGSDVTNDVIDFPFQRLV